MSELPALFSDLALILVTAGVTTILFKWLKQPLVLGYIIAGFLIGPYMTLFPGINDHESVHLWSEIGMVFLLFAIGLEFSFKKLKKVAGTVGITALTELISMCIIGFFLGKLLGWSQMDSIFLGCMLAMSSTTIIAKAFEDLKLTREKFTQGVIGVLVVEDLAAILMMVILSTIAVSTSFNGAELAMSVVKLVFFLLIFYIGGMFLIPSFLKLIRRFMSEETLTVVAVGLCFFMVWLATKFGFSSALGAFLMGSILAETLEAEMVHKLTKPIKDLFGAVFFVSVGMMVNPSILVQYWWQILVITIVVILLKSLSSGVGMLLAGNNLKDSVCAGVCFGQIGEFSFIIATVGMSFGVIDDFLYPIIVSVSIITTFITPYAIKSGSPLYSWMDKKIPAKWKETMENKNKGIKTKAGEKVTMRAFLIRQLKNIVIYSSITFAVMWLCFGLAAIINQYVPMPFGNIIGIALTIVITSPFVWALAFRHKKNDTRDKLQENSKFSDSAVQLSFIVGFLIALGFEWNMIHHFFSKSFWASMNLDGGIPAIWVALIFAIGVTLLLRVISPAMKWYKRIENNFLENMNKRQSQQTIIVPEILQENFTLEKMELSVKSPYVGKTIKETDFRDNYNISVVCVERGDEITNLPDKDFVLYPHDEITFVGSEAHLNLLKSRVIIEDEILIKEKPESDVALHEVDIAENDPFLGMMLRETKLRERHFAMVVAVERDGDFILNPSANIRFEVGDHVWFVSTTEKAKELAGIHLIND